MVIKNSEPSNEALQLAIKYEERLWTAARFEASESGFEFTFPCGTVVRDLIRAGVKQMLKSYRMSAMDFEEAEENWSKFMATMLKEALKNPSKADRNPLLKKQPLRESAFVMAKHECPAWPFC